MPQDYAKYRDTVIDPKTQEMLNKPLPAGEVDPKYAEFLDMLLKKFESGEINPHLASSLYNRAVYEKLSENDREKADMTAINLMSVIRQIEMLWRLEHKASFEVMNLVETVFRMKSGFEELHGDVYII
ncbi:hypothetical protein JXA05_03465 [Candidatus Peregrinibacteria bacterium]|nr:hypothetical protein [Candidatus Peregrinibacteria bacterium]